MISWNSLGREEGQLTRTKEAVRTEEAELHALQDKYEDAMNLFSRAQDLPSLREIQQTLTEIAAHDVFLNVHEQKTNDKAHLYFLVMKNLGRIALELKDLLAAMSAYETAADLRIEDTSVWIKLAAVAQQLNQSWYCRLACDHVLSHQPWNFSAKQMLNWADHGFRIDVKTHWQPEENGQVPHETLWEANVVVIEVAELCESWIVLGKKLIQAACVSQTGAVYLEFKQPEPNRLNDEPVVQSTCPAAEGTFNYLEALQPVAMEVMNEDVRACSSPDPVGCNDGQFSVEKPNHDAEPLTQSSKPQQVDLRRSQRHINRVKGIPQGIDESKRTSNAIKMLEGLRIIQALPSDIRFVDRAAQELEKIQSDKLFSPTPEKRRHDQESPPLRSESESSTVQELLIKYTSALVGQQTIYHAAQLYLEYTSSILQDYCPEPTDIGRKIIEPSTTCAMIVRLWDLLQEHDPCTWGLSRLFHAAPELAIVISESFAELSAEGLHEEFARDLIRHRMNESALLASEWVLSHISSHSSGINDMLLLRMCWLALLTHCKTHSRTDGVIPMMELMRMLLKECGQSVKLHHRKQFNEISVERLNLFEQRITVRSTLLQLTAEFVRFTDTTPSEALEDWFGRAAVILFADDTSDELCRGVKLRLALDSTADDALLDDVQRRWLPLGAMSTSLRLRKTEVTLRLLGGILRDTLELLYSRSDAPLDLANTVIQSLLQIDVGTPILNVEVSHDTVMPYCARITLVAVKNMSWTLVRSMHDLCLRASPSGSLPNIIASIIFSWFLDFRLLELTRKRITAVAQSLALSRAFSYETGQHPLDIYHGADARNVVNALVQTYANVERMMSATSTPAQDIITHISTLLCRAFLCIEDLGDLSLRMQLAAACYMTYSSNNVTEDNGRLAMHTMETCESILDSINDSTTENVESAVEHCFSILGQTYYDVYGLDVWAESKNPSLRREVPIQRLPIVYRFIKRKIDEGTPKRADIRTTLQILEKHPLISYPRSTPPGYHIISLFVSSSSAEMNYWDFARDLLANLNEAVVHESQADHVHQSFYHLLAQALPENALANRADYESNHARRIQVLLTDLSFNPARVDSWWKLAITLQAYYERLSDRLSEECFEDVLPCAAHDMLPFDRLDPWTHQLLLELPTTRQLVVEELQPRVHQLLAEIHAAESVRRGLCSCSAEFLANCCLYRNAARTLALRALFVFVELISRSNNLSPSFNVQQAIPDAFERVCLIASNSYLETYSCEDLKRQWLLFLVQAVEQGVQAASEARPATKYFLQFTRAISMGKVSGSYVEVVSALQHVLLNATESRIEKRQRSAIHYRFHACNAKLALTSVLETRSSTTSVDDQDAQTYSQAHGDAWRRLTASFEGLRECRRGDSCEPRSVFLITRIIVALQDVNVPTIEVASALNRLGIDAHVGSPVDVDAAKEELVKLFDKKRLEIVALWFPSQISDGHDRADSRRIKFDSRRRKYLMLYLDLLVKTYDTTRLQEILSWSLASKARTAFTRWACLCTARYILQQARAELERDEGAGEHCLTIAFDAVTDLLAQPDMVPFVEQLPAIETLQALLDVTSDNLPAADYFEPEERLVHLLKRALSILPHRATKNSATKKLYKAKLMQTRRVSGANSQDEAVRGREKQAHISSKKRDSHHLPSIKFIPEKRKRAISGARALLDSLERQPPRTSQLILQPRPQTVSPILTAQGISQFIPKTQQAGPSILRRPVAQRAKSGVALRRSSSLPIHTPLPTLQPQSASPAEAQSHITAQGPQNIANP